MSDVTPAEPYRRVAGVLLPLFSMRSSGGWGIGEFPDVAPFSLWMRDAGLSLLQLLPLNEMSAGQNSPYSALASAALDPIFLSPDAMPGFARAGGIDALPKAAREALEAARQSNRVDFDAVRQAKDAAFAIAWQAESAAGHEADAWAQFLEREAYWLDDYALFRAVADAHGPNWQDWPAALAAREPKAMAAARAKYAERIRFYGWLQWVAGSQWDAAREAAHAQGVALFGDVPFMVNAASADVWARQHDFMLDASVGTPPDAFSDIGQDWGVPVYRWHEIAAGDYQWLRARARRAAALYDGFRVDHLVGFYRTFVRPHDGSEPYFLPEGEQAHLHLGETLMRMFLDTGAAVTAEDLGTVPEYVRASLNRLRLPGYRILRWERRWDDPGQPFRPPSEWPEIAVATTGTHDTESSAEWWEAAPPEERRQVLGDAAPATFTDAVRDALLTSLYRSPSNLLILPFQDLFGWRDRINTPATVGDQNWVWALPWPVDEMRAESAARKRGDALRDLAEVTGRR